MSSAPSRRPTILLAGGGSGGHISPSLAIAEQLTERDEADVLFVCSTRAIDARMLESAGVTYVTIPARPPSVRPRRLLSFLRAYRRSRLTCRDLIRTRGVTSVVAMGGFVAAPAAAAARSLRVPVTLMNLDRPPGRANRWIAGRCDRVWSAIDLPEHRGFAERVVGMPLRRRAIAPAPAAECRARLGLDADRATLLVTGASQGATSINRLLLAHLELAPGTFDGWQVCHLTGDEAEERVRAAYASAGVRARVMDFTDEIGVAWGAADLAVSRAGANSVAEVLANAVPTLFLPYPYHRDEHQRHNAQPLVDAGGAIVETDRIDASANVEHAGAVLRTLMEDPTRRDAMREGLERHRTPGAAALVASLLLAP